MKAFEAYKISLQANIDKTIPNEIIKDIQKSAQEGYYSVTYDEQINLSKFAWVVNNEITFKDLGYEVIHYGSIFGYGSVVISWKDAICSDPTVRRNKENAGDE